MKKILSTLMAVALFACLNLNAQNQVIRKGNFNYSLGLGLIPTYFADDATIDVPPLSLRIGYGISDHFNINAYIGYSSSTSSLISDPIGLVSRQYENDFLMIGIRSELHAMRNDKVDVYGGFMLGYSNTFIDESNFVVESESPIDAPINTSALFSQNEGGKMLVSGFVGATFFINDKLGLYGELGYGVSLLNMGVTFKI